LSWFGALLLGRPDFPLAKVLDTTDLSS